MWYALLSDSSLVEPKENIHTSIIFKTDRYSNHFNTLIPTLAQSKSFKFEDPRSHAPESNAELMISPKKMISSMLAPIPVIYEKNWYVQGGSNMTGTVYTCKQSRSYLNQLVYSLCLFFSFALWRTVMIHRLFSHRFYWLKTESSKIFQFSKFFFFSLFLAPNFMFNLLGSRNVSSQCTDTIWYKVRNKIPSIFCFTFPLLCCICWSVTDS